MENTTAAASPLDIPVRPLVDGAKLVEHLLDQQWHQRCEILPEYMPRFPSKDTRPTVQVRFNDGSEYPPFLRYSCGPKQGFFWDIYGDDMQSIELAVIALSQAPAPRNVGPITFTLPLRSNARLTGATPEGGASELKR